MLVWLCHWLSHWFSAFRVFHYITFRVMLSTLTALCVSLATGSRLIAYLQAKQWGQVVRVDGPESHFSKRGTPTMGGILIVLALTISSLLWGDLHNVDLWVVIAVTLGFSAIGWYDDLKKIRTKQSHGLSARWKYLSQSGIALVALIFLYTQAHLPAQIDLLIPFVKYTTLPLGVGFIVLGYFVVVGSSNAVNLTDGLDGLALMPAVMVGGALAVFAYVGGNVSFAGYLNLPYLPGVGELAVFCGALVGAGLGFLWFNAYPAQVFMGDVGSLAIGAALGMVAVLVRQELIFFLMSGVFVVETVSVILQVASFKLTGKRIFKMAPLHHHFELKGWPEPRITVRFWIITLVLVLVALMSLKIR